MEINMYIAIFDFSEYNRDINKICYMLFNQIFITRNIVFIHTKGHYEKYEIRKGFR
jgi:hypothetical protein